MSTDAVPPGAAPGATLDARAVARFAVGTALAWVGAYASGFPLPFLPPMLTGLLLASPRPMGLRAVGYFVGFIVLAGVLGLLVVWYFADQPPLMLLVVLAVFLNAYYGLAGGAPRLLVTLLLMMTALLPVVGRVSKPATPLLAVAMVAAGALAVLTHYLAWALVPASETRATTRPPPAVEPPPTPTERVRRAWLSTLLAFPVVALGIALGASSATTFLVMVVLFAMDPTVEASREAARQRVPATVIGGLVAIGVFAVLYVVDDFAFFLLLTLLAGLYFGRRIVAGGPSAEVHKTAYTTFVLLIGQSTTLGADTVEKFVLRLVQVAGALAYVLALSWLASAPGSRREVVA